MSALELIAEVAKHPTLDEYLARDTKQVTEAQRIDQVLALRAVRARQITGSRRRPKAEENADG